MGGSSSQFGDNRCEASLTNRRGNCQRARRALLLTTCLALASPLSASRASAQSAAPEVVSSNASMGPTGTVQTPTAATPRQQAWLRATTDARVRIAETLGEDGARAFARSRGYTPLLDGTDRVLRQGLDQVYTTADKTVHVFEAKGGGSPLGKAYGFEQGTPEWAVESAKRVAHSGKAGATEKAAAEAVLRAAKEGRLQVHVIRTRHVLGEPFAAVLERTLSGTDDAARLAASTLDDLGRAASAGTRGAGSKGVAAAAEAASGAAKPVSKVLGTVARMAPVVGAVVDGGLRVKAGTEIEQRYARSELNQQGREVEHAKNVAGMAGGWGGALAGAKLGAMTGGAVGTAFGGVGAPVGATAGGVAGGVAGYFGGEAAAEVAAEWTVHQVHAAGTTISEGAGRAWSATAQTAGSSGTAVKNLWSRATGW